MLTLFAIYLLLSVLAALSFASMISMTAGDEE